MDTLISIITPAYNCSDLVGKTIEAIQAQTYKNWEMLIVDDCSTDNTADVIKSYAEKDERIKYYCLEKNGGAAVARTRAMELAKGNYMAFCDSDDLWHCEKLEKQLKFMEDNGYNFSSTAYEQIDESGKPLGKILKSPKKITYNRMLLDCPVGNSSMMYNVDKMGKFKVPNIKKRNDYALWLSMLKCGECVYGMDEVLMQYRVRQNSISSNKVSLLKYHWKLYREIEHLTIFRSAFHCGWFVFIKVFKIK